MPVQARQYESQLADFMPTTDELTPVQRQGMKTAKAVS